MRKRFGKLLHRFAVAHINIPSAWDSICTRFANLWLSSPNLFSGLLDLSWNIQSASPLLTMYVYVYIHVYIYISLFIRCPYLSKTERLVILVSISPDHKIPGRVKVDEDFCRHGTARILGLSPVHTAHASAAAPRTLTWNPRATGFWGKLSKVKTPK